VPQSAEQSAAGCGARQRSRSTSRAGRDTAPHEPHGDMETGGDHDIQSDDVPHLHDDDVLPMHMDPPEDLVDDSEPDIADDEQEGDDGQRMVRSTTLVQLCLTLSGGGSGAVKGTCRARSR
jgi:hypothetical protein